MYIFMCFCFCLFICVRSYVLWGEWSDTLRVCVVRVCICVCVCVLCVFLHVPIVSASAGPCVYVCVPESINE